MIKDNSWTDVFITDADARIYFTRILTNSVRLRRRNSWIDMQPSQ
jgi:hypothetical protein